MNNSKELLFLGLPETGKTTFFVALDEVLEWQPDKHGLVSDGFAANRTYIESAKKAWRAGRPVERTNLMTMDEPVELRVRHQKLNASASLVAPDVNGEFFDDQWTDRKWPTWYRSKLKSAGGIFAFINASFTGRNSEITAAWVNLPQEQTAMAIPWKPKAAAKQLKMVDLLQCISEFSQITRPVPLALMISAWDVVEPRDKPTIQPENFLRIEWSLLHQYLENNPESFRHHIYGVSARGGDDAAQSKLLAKRPYERVWLKDGKEVTGDLTLPLRWMLGWE